MKTGKPREVVSVVIPEGFTLNKIADRLEENQVCTRSDFFRAANTVMYEYDFLKDLPTDEERIYPLEGYLFPDTYEFYTNSSGETVVRKFLDNFNARVDTSLKAAIKARGMTIDQAVILASIIQGEAADTDNMNKVSRVLQNRLENPVPIRAWNAIPPAAMPRIWFPARAAARYSSRRMIPMSGRASGRPHQQSGPGRHPGGRGAFRRRGNQTVLFLCDGVYRRGPAYFYSKTYAQHKKTCEKYGIGIHAKS